MPPLSTKALSLPHLGLLIFGVLMSASAVLMIKASTVPPALLASFRLLGAALLLLPVWWWNVRRVPVRDWWPLLRPSLLPGVFLGLHFISWNAGARATQAGNATLVVNMVPLVMPFLAWAFLREHPTRREMVGTALALAGIAYLGWGDYHFSPEHLVGDGLCFVAMLLYSVYILLARKRARPGGLVLYLTPLYTAGALVCLAWSALFEGPWPTLGVQDWWLALGLVVGPTLAGHSLANWSMTILRAQTVSLINLMQFVFAGLLAFVFFQEVPGQVFYVTAALVVTGAAVALAPSKRPPVSSN